MRLAISGSHATGKSTLAGELRSALTDYTFVDEAYAYLLDEGHELGAEPTLEDFAAQLRRSVSLILEIDGPNVIFDRCPVDYLAYLAALHADGDELRDSLMASVDALRTLNAVIFVPVEARDRIPVHREDLPKLRNRVDLVLRDMLVDDGWDLKLNTIQVHGSPSDRAQQLLRWLNAGDALAR